MNAYTKADFNREVQEIILEAMNRKPAHSDKFFGEHEYDLSLTTEETRKIISELNRAFESTTTRAQGLRLSEAQKDAVNYIEDCKNDLFANLGYLLLSLEAALDAHDYDSRDSELRHATTEAWMRH